MSGDRSLILFDCDGTLIDSAGQIVESMRRAFARAGLSAPSEEQVRSIVGLSLTRAIHRLVPDADMAEIERLGGFYRQAWSQVMVDPAFDDPLYESARDVVTSIRSYADLGVATGKSRRGLDRVLEKHQMAHLFDVLMTADDGPSKPDPFMVNQCMLAVGAEPAQTVMIGDTSYDMEMAQAADVHAIGVSWGNHDRATLEAAGAHVILDHFDELEPYLKKTGYAS